MRLNSIIEKSDLVEIGSLLVQNLMEIVIVVEEEELIGIFHYQFEQSNVSVGQC